MKKISLLIALIAIINVCEGQYNPRPTKSRFFNSKHSTFQVKPGDILVYTVTNNGEQYDFVVRVKQYGNAINFDYDVPQKNQKGNISVSNSSVAGGNSYANYFATSTVPENSSVWLSKQNWRDLASKDKKTSMNFGTGTETFVREDASTLKIKYKGRSKILTTYNIANENSGKTFSVLTDEKNPLIVSMNSGWTMTLKEVR